MTTQWHDARREMQPIVTEVLGGDWLAVYADDWVYAVNTRTGTAARLLSYDGVVDNLYKTPEFINRLHSIRVEAEC